MSRMRIMSQAGDEEIKWDPGDEESTAEAKAKHDKLKKDGFEFFRVEAGRPKRMKRWDPAAGDVLAVPGVQRRKERKSPAQPAGERQRAMAGGPNASLTPTPR